MTGLIPENLAMAKVSGGTATCPGNQRICMTEFLADVQSGAASHDGGTVEGLDLEVQTPHGKVVGKNGHSSKGGEHFEQALETAAADLRRTWARQRKLVIRAFERQYRKRVEELEPWWDYSFGLTADSRFKEPTLHVIWELKPPAKWPDGKTPSDPHLHHKAVHAGHNHETNGGNDERPRTLLQKLFGR